MKKDGHYASPEIQDILQDLNVQWKVMCDKAKDKGSKLRQAADQETLNKALADAQVSKWVVEIYYFTESALMIINVGKRTLVTSRC